ncbi:hypothetical protein ACLOJK_017264 [Asimina triloba]
MSLSREIRIEIKEFKPGWTGSQHISTSLCLPRRVRAQSLFPSVRVEKRREEKRNEEKQKGMSDPYERAKAGRLTFKGGIPLKSADKHKKKRKKSKKAEEDLPSEAFDGGDGSAKDGTGQSDGAGDLYTIDPMKRMKYDELFPVESKKFGYEGREKSKSVEEALDDRVKKKADRYCNAMLVLALETIRNRAARAVTEPASHGLKLGRKCPLNIISFGLWRLMQLEAVMVATVLRGIYVICKSFQKCTKASWSRT